MAFGVTGVAGGPSPAPVGLTAPLSQHPVVVQCYGRGANLMARASKKLESLSFEQILERLEGVVEKLEKGDAPLAEALATFEEGVGLSRLGSQHLDEAERRIEILLQDAEGVRTRSMDKESAFDE